MTVRGRWRIVEMPDYEADYPDMMGPGSLVGVDRKALRAVAACDPGLAEVTSHTIVSTSDSISDYAVFCGFKTVVMSQVMGREMQSRQCARSI